MAWVRKFFTKNPLERRNDVERTYEDFVELMKKCERHINTNYEVESLCRGVPKRLGELVDEEGGRIWH